jgi:hypothetical protein
VKRALFSALVPTPVITLLWTRLAQSQSAGNPNSEGKLRVAVVVSDAKGAPLPALRSDDFTIEVAGKNASGDFQIVAPSSEAGKQAQPAARSSSSDGRGLVVVVLDTIHTPLARRQRCPSWCAEVLVRFCFQKRPCNLVRTQPRWKVESGSRIPIWFGNSGCGLGARGWRTA